MPFAVYSDVILTRDVTERGLRAGDVGTVVERHRLSRLDCSGRAPDPTQPPVNASRLSSSCRRIVSAIQWTSKPCALPMSSRTRCKSSMK
jgi:hypothetical protein